MLTESGWEARVDEHGDSESPDKTVKFVNGDVLEARGDEMPESKFTEEEAKAEDA